jgi:hypothetical protein
VAFLIIEAEILLDWDDEIESCSITVYDEGD